MAINFTVESFSREFLEKTFNPTKRILNRIDYIFGYFETLKTEIGNQNITIVKEHDYIDKFYLRDYSRYYAESFHKFQNRSERLHFFTGKFSEGEFIEILKSGNEQKNIGPIGEKNKFDYLGNITVKPVGDEYDSKLMGRTAIAPYPIKQGENIRHHLKIKNECSLFGLDLQINSLPFHEQDIAVGACASASLWIAQYGIKKWYDIPIRSLAEITELSRLQTPYALPSPLYPSEGLSPSEIVSYLENIGLHFQIFDIEALIQKKIELKTKTGVEVSLSELIEDIIKAYFRADFPIICNLDMGENDDYQGHAVVLSGYKENNSGEIIELYLHDDKIGPYCRTKFDSDRKDHWINNWVTSKIIKKIVLRKFIIPLDPFIKLHFFNCFNMFYEWKNKLEKIDFRLYHISAYRKKIISKNFPDKENILSENMPRYIWVAHLYDDDPKINSRDVIFDANEIFLRKPIKEIEFK